MKPAPIDLVVLTGFLGSGKTTLLRDLVASPDGADTAIIVNEVGEIGLDGALLREAGGDVAMRMLAGGCICCQAGSDLALTVEALLAVDRPGAAARPLARIVLETSGLSKPGPILRQLAGLARHPLRLVVVATCDATRDRAAPIPDEAAAQWAGAHRLVLTKTDLVNSAAFAAARDGASDLNPLAEIVAAPDRAESVRAAFAPPAAPFALPALRGEDIDDPHPNLRTLLIRQRQPVAYDDLAAWLDNLAGRLGDRLLRLKGLVRVAEDAERPLLVESVGTVFSAPRPFRGAPPEGVPFLVVIGRDLTATEVEEVRPPMPFSVGSRPAAPLRAKRPTRPVLAESLDE